MLQYKYSGAYAIAASGLRLISQLGLEYVIAANPFLCGVTSRSQVSFSKFPQVPIYDHPKKGGWIDLNAQVGIQMQARPMDS